MRCASVGCANMGVSSHQGPLCESPYNKDHSVLGPLSGTLVLGISHIVPNNLVAESLVAPLKSFTLEGRVRCLDA